jgi:hypothetical protein
MRCKRAQMANFLLARAETGARGKESLLMGGGARKRATYFSSRKNRLPLALPSTLLNIVTQNDSPQHVGQACGRAVSKRADVLLWSVV